MKTPFTSKTQIVQDSWIDYNGHMNVGYYTFAFDTAIDQFLDEMIGIGPKFVETSGQGSYALQSQYRYLQELMLNMQFNISIFIADIDSKRLHLMLDMKALKDPISFATCETVLVNVDLKERKSCDYPEFAQEKLKNLYESSKHIRANTRIGHPIGLAKKSLY